jgi:hypothetical protein
VLWWKFSEARNAPPWTIDCSQVRRPARQELTRRGHTGRSSDKPISPVIRKERKVYGRTSVCSR